MTDEIAGPSPERPRDVSAEGNRIVRTALRRRWRPLVGGTMLATTHQASEALVPVLIGVVIDRAIRTGDGGAMLLWTVSVAGLFVVLATAGLLGYYLLERAGLLITHDVRQAVTGRVLDPRGGAGGRSGEVMSLASSDADGVGEAAFAVGLTIAALPALAFSGVILLSSSTQLGLVVLIGLPVVIGLVAVLTRPLVRRAEEEQDAVAGAAGVITDLVHGLRVLKGIGAEAAAAERYRVSSRAALTARLRSARFLGGYETATFAISGAFLVVVAWVGGRLAVSGEITIGQLVAAVGLAQFLVDPLSMLIEAGAQGARVRACARRVRTFLNQPPGILAPSAPRPVPFDVSVAIELDQVSFAGLRSVSLSVDSGSMVGVVADPATAATLVDVLARTLDPVSGEVRVFGVAYSAVDLAELRRRVVVARHDAVLFSGTIGEQLSLPGTPGRFAPSDEPSLLASTALAEVVDAVPGGLDAVVGDAGRALSGGQRQRVLLARAVAVGADVLVVHDPTTAVDASTEASIADGLRDLRRGATTIVIASSPTLLARCDRVVMFGDGGIVADGTHATLVTDSQYAAMVLT